MVDSTDDLNLDVDGPKGGGKGKLIIIIAAVSGLLLLTAGATLWFAGFFDGDADADATAVSAPARSETPSYLPINQAFTVNLRSEDRRARYLQVEMTLMTYQRGALSGVETHMPVIRNNVNRLLAAQDAEHLLTEEGRGELQAGIVDEINAVLEQQGVGGRIESVYFTKLIMQ